MKIVHDTPAIVQESRSGFRHEMLQRTISHRDFTDETIRCIDSRPCEAFGAADYYGGALDSLANVPHSKTPGWVRAALIAEDVGDE